MAIWWAVGYNRLLRIAYRASHVRRSTVQGDENESKCLAYSVGGMGRRSLLGDDVDKQPARRRASGTSHAIGIPAWGNSKCIVGRSGAAGQDRTGAVQAACHGKGRRSDSRRRRDAGAGRRVCSGCPLARPHRSRERWSSNRCVRRRKTASAVCARSWPPKNLPGARATCGRCGSSTPWPRTPRRRPSLSWPPGPMWRWCAWIGGSSGLKG